MPGSEAGNPIAGPRKTVMGGSPRRAASARGNHPFARSSSRNCAMGMTGRSGGGRRWWLALGYL